VNKIENENRGIQTMNDNFNYLKEEINNLTFKFQPIRKKDENAENAEKDVVEVNFNEVKEAHDFLNVIEDFYFVESISNLDLKENNKGAQMHISNIKKISTSHGNLLRLAFFYFSELEKCINGCNSTDVDEYYLDMPYLDMPYLDMPYLDMPYLDMLYSNSIEAMFEFLIEKSTNNDYVIERLYVLNILYTIITNYVPQKNIIPDWRYKFVGNTIQFYHLIEYTKKLFKHIKEYFNKNIKIHEEMLMNFISDKGLNHVGKCWRISNFAEKLQKVLENYNVSWCSNYIKNKFNCFATASLGNKKFFTINGLENSEICVNSNKDIAKNVIEELLKNENKNSELEYVGVTKDTRYYWFTKEVCYINYEEFKKSNPDKTYNRMFACCERKLFAKIRDNSNRSNNKVVLNITKELCQICKRERDLFQNLIINSHKEESNLPQEKLEQMDKFAKKIFKDVNQLD